MFPTPATDAKKKASAGKCRSPLKINFIKNKLILGLMVFQDKSGALLPAGFHWDN